MPAYMHIYLQVFSNYLTFCGIGLTNAKLYQRSIWEYRRNRVCVEVGVSGCARVCSLCAGVLRPSYCPCYAISTLHMLHSSPPTLCVGSLAASPRSV